MKQAPLELRGINENGRLLWSAIFGGVFSSMGLGILLSLFGLACGFSLFKANVDNMGTMAGVGLAWLIVSGMMAMFVCGWIAAYFARTSCFMKGALHGLVAWSLATVLGVLTIGMGAGSLVVGAGQLIGEGITLAGEGAAGLASPVADQLNQGESKQFKSIGEQISQLIGSDSNSNSNSNSSANSQSPSRTQIQQPDQTRSRLSGDDLVQQVINSKSEMSSDMLDAVQDYLSNDSEDKVDQLRQATVDLLVKNTSLDKNQASEIVDTWHERYQTMKEKIKKAAQAAAEKTGEVLAQIAIAAFFTLLLGVIATISGAVLAIVVKRREQSLDNQPQS